MTKGISMGLCVALVGGFLLQGCGAPDPAPEAAPAPEAEAAPMEKAEAPAPAAEAAPAPAPEAAPEAAFVIKPGPDANEEIQTALIEAEPGDVILLEEGTFNIALGLSLDVENVTLRGRGMDKTILNFTGQVSGSEGLHITSDDVTLEDFAIVDTKGNAFKSHSTDNIIYRRLKAEWTGGPKPENGAYGFYPVNSTNVLIDECVAIGASDAGIYVGQSKNVLVRNSRAEFNVAGIEIENCHGADVIGCVATNNTGGLLVFDLPDLPVQRGHDVRLLNNKVFDNNTPNFAPEGNIVGSVSKGTGVMVMANSNVEIFNNEIGNNATINVMVVSYLATGKTIKDPNYYPYSEKVHIHGNTFGKVGFAPDEKNAALMVAVMGAPLPDIMWDGVSNPEGEEPGVVIGENTKEEGELTFANMGGLDSLLNPGGFEVDRNIEAYTGTLPAIDPIVIEGAA